MSVCGPSKPPRPSEPQAACWLAEGGVSCPGPWGLERLLGVPDLLLITVTDGGAVAAASGVGLGLGPPLHSLCGGGPAPQACSGLRHPAPLLTPFPALTRQERRGRPPHSWMAGSHGVPVNPLVSWRLPEAGTRRDEWIASEKQTRGLPKG